MPQQGVACACEHAGLHNKWRARHRCTARGRGETDVQLFAGRIVAALAVADEVERDSDRRAGRGRGHRPPRAGTHSTLCARTCHAALPAGRARSRQALNPPTSSAPLAAKCHLQPVAAALRTADPTHADAQALVQGHAKMNSSSARRVKIAVVPTRGGASLKPPLLFTTGTT